MNVTDLLEQRGTLFYNTGRKLITAFTIALGIYVLIMIIGMIGWGINAAPYILAVDTGLSLVDMIIVLCYLSIALSWAGFPFYFNGLHCLGLAQIAANTSGKEHARLIL